MFPNFSSPLNWLVLILSLSVQTCVFASTAQNEVDLRLQRFYESPSEGDMSQPIPKFDARTQQPAQVKSKLKRNLSAANPLTRLAGEKASEAYTTQYCSQVLDKKFPELKCSSSVGKAAIHPNDKVEDLTKSWVKRNVRNLSKIPTEGETEIGIWSDDYWRIQFGVTSYRYSEGVEYPSYLKAVAAYAQPAEWNSLLKQNEIAEMAKKVSLWSPSEKYDLAVGDQHFTMTLEQKGEGKPYVSPGKDVESWMGICHGWAAAAIVVPGAQKVVTVTGAEGVSVEFFPADIRALTSLAFANGKAPSNFIGGRCDAKKAETFKNGRLSQQECFDTNPATFHLALGNMIGIEKASFVMDKTFDAEVWNQPIQSYEFTYFNPNQPTKRSKNWEEVAVAYDGVFKKKDRFQKPLTRGAEGGTLFGGVKFNDKKVVQIVGVIAKVTYLSEITPTQSETADENSLVEETYTYDLELSKVGGELQPTGGEWHENSHPDFLWVPVKGAVAKSNYDRLKLDFNGKSEPEAEITQAASAASQSGNPLCAVVSHLVRESSGVRSYQCK